ncbi:MAG: GreA/GreB family elongation factor [Gammaproteobacteria bacterium]
MSRAFVKESDGDADLPDLPLSPHPNYTTPDGREAMGRRLAAAQRALAGASADQAAGRVAVDGRSLAQWQREVRWLEARLAAAIVVPPPATPPERVIFGVEVQLEDEHGQRYRFRIVGEDEADLARGRISWVSPLARALLGARVDDEVLWPRPEGDLAVAVLAIGC